VTAVPKPMSARAGYPAWIALYHLTAMLNSDQKQKMLQAVRNESKLALGVVFKCAAALLILELLVRVVTSAGLRVDGGPFPLGAAPVLLPPALVHTPLPPAPSPPGAPHSR
jgi:hypothetical protein